jgi:ribonuclease HII
MGRLCCARYEREARQHGWQRIAGLDEAGRGSLFGPVVAAAVILNPKRRIVGLDDSKKLSADRRAELAELIHAHALAWATAEIAASRIDAWNIYQASRQAMVAAVSQFQPLPDYLLLDAIEIDLPIEQKALIHGDARSVSIAAASILAKVERDRRMEQFDQLYPQYGLAQNKGYGTPLHRFSYAPVREARCWAAGATQDALPLANPPTPAGS